MEEAWELAAVSFFEWVGRRRSDHLQKSGKLRRRHASEVDLDAQATVYLNDLKECKYLLAGAAAALFFVIDAYKIDLSVADTTTQSVLLPFLTSFLFAAAGYWNCYKMDEKFFALKFLARKDPRTELDEEDINRVSNDVFGRNYIIAKSILVSATAFFVGVIFVALSVVTDFF